MSIARSSKAAALLLVLCAAPASAAETCTLQSLGALPVTALPDGGVGVPVTTGAGHYLFTLDLGSPQTLVSDALARSRYASISRTHGFEYRGMAVEGEATLPDLNLAAMTGRAVPVLVLAGGAPLPPKVTGVAGAVLLGNADLEIDLAQDRVALFAPEHCPGQGVTWADSAAVIPFARNGDRRIVFTMQLDGKDVTASFGASGAGEMPLSVAHHLFGMGPGALADPHPFKTLAAGGIAFANPAIRIVDDTALGCNRQNKSPACFGRADLELGMTQLKSLHLFVAFSEGKIYATAAGAHR